MHPRAIVYSCSKVYLWHHDGTTKLLASLVVPEWIYLCWEIKRESKGNTELLVISGGRFTERCWGDRLMIGWYITKSKLDAP